ncbi:hypothetical protein PR048_013220 [Dryococelus australis]|uniref:Uncharacterized protein n=1 Tax=Dryococelus australis TaxID=614101 RepID=A0ABQ9HRQ2_9NEOP|nr:hypothetical protein PR048_013220 [Dryococelus australis]
MPITIVNIKPFIQNKVYVGLGTRCYNGKIQCSPKSYFVRKNSRGRVVRYNTTHLRPSHFKGTGQTDNTPEQEETEKGHSKSTSVENDKEDFKGFENSESVEESVHTDTEDFKGFTGYATQATCKPWWKKGTLSDHKLSQSKSGVVRAIVGQ